MTQLVLRFDIDTTRCIQDGMPNLLRLAREQGVRFTFFCNMGRAISWPALVRNSFRRSHHGRGPYSARKLSSITKLGIRHLLRTVLVNPRVGASNPDILGEALNDGHDVGLHGGKNHGDWQYNFQNWSIQRIEQEVAAGKALYERAVGVSPWIFSSPGWQGSDTLDSVLRSTGFKASADRHGPDENDVIFRDGFCTLPTNLVAEPGGVAFIESLAAQGLDDQAIVERFAEQLHDDRKLLVLYDHPCFAGIRGLNALRGVVQYALEQGIELIPYSSLMEAEPTS